MTPDSSSVAFPATTDTARPLTFDRVVDVVDALIDHFKSDADEAEITFRLPKFDVLIGLAGKWGEVLLVKGTLNASVEPCLAGYLAQTINDMNTRRMVPVAYTSVTERGYLLTHLRASLDAEAWVTDAQLRDFLDTAIGTMVDSVRELSEAVPRGRRSAGRVRGGHGRGPHHNSPARHGGPHPRGAQRGRHRAHGGLRGRDDRTLPYRR
ncbi:YbjN domain-containing protein [Corynebacterium phoceense]|uniref:YbjN domain-containing protein n=1 Tax=Corynebacterium phoceense TaxID=1686286 RepID=UPI00211CC09C|nr:YbjN domain-containing protein [Corynebacterium phoceense]